MDCSAALAALIAHTEASDGPVNIGSTEVQQWDHGVLDQFLETGLLTPTINANSLECPGCEHHCAMPVLLTDDGSERAFIICDHNEMQSQMGRISVSKQNLKQWKSSAHQFSDVVSKFLEFKTKPEYKKDSAIYRLGMLQSTSGRRWVSLHTKPLQIEINSHTAPLSELLYFDNLSLRFDMPRIEELLQSPSVQKGKTYQPDTSKREARRLATQAMHQDWKDAYLELKGTYPTKPNDWISKQIAKKDIAQGRDSETIRKNMK